MKRYGHDNFYITHYECSNGHAFNENSGKISCYHCSHKRFELLKIERDGEVIYEKNN